VPYAKQFTLHFPAPDGALVVMSTASERFGLTCKLSRWETHLQVHFAFDISRFHSQKVCLDQAKALSKSQCWEALMRYILIAWKYTSKLPDWDELSHNALKAQCFSVLAAQCMLALKQGNFSHAVLKKFLPKLKNAASLNTEISPCISFAEKTLAQE
jgi:hypothetical protein